MRTLIRDTTIQIGDQQLEYYPYYFGIWDRDEDHRLCVRHTIWQWAAGLRQLDDNRQVVHLPYFLDDQWCGCLQATRKKNKVVLRRVEIIEAGYAIDLNDISDVMFGDHQYHSEAESDLGEYDRDELIQSFEQAEIVED